jgi:two-component system, cell cycle response regulator DivK
MTTALIIEDNDDNMALISFILQSHGYDTVKSWSGEEGMQRLSENHELDFVILDIQLPGMDGVEVLRRIREMDAARTLPVIAMTSYAMSGDRQRLLDAGCSGYIDKPVDPARVIDQIREILGQ